jgi:UDP-glucuronate 4-epimerase
MKILVTGAAGFIGFYVAKRLLELGNEVAGIDNLNGYYDVRLKYARLSQLGIAEPATDNTPIASSRYPSLRFAKMQLEDKAALRQLFATEKFDSVCHLAAQAGVRYSIDNPDAYISSNIIGFFNLLECCRHYPVRHLVYASSSSVYGQNSKVPFSENDKVDCPVSLYAATKRSNELLAYSYSHLYGIPATGLRFFTVYGPWGRPDMSPFLFMDAIMNDRPIKVFNHGDMLRDFTYVDDIVEAVTRVMAHIPAALPGAAPHRLYNIGNSTPVKLMDFIQTIESLAGKPAKKEFLPMQPGDVYQTNADTTALANAIGFKPNTSLKEGLTKTVEWYRTFYQK